MSLIKNSNPKESEIYLIGWKFRVINGILYAYFPDRKAAALNPIDALRYE